MLQFTLINGNGRELTSEWGQFLSFYSVMGIFNLTHRWVGEFSSALTRVITFFWWKCEKKSVKMSERGWWTIIRIRINNSNLMRWRENNLAIEHCVSFWKYFYLHTRCSNVVHRCHENFKILHFSLHSSSAMFNWVWNRCPCDRIWFASVFRPTSSSSCSLQFNSLSKQNTWKCKTCDRSISRRLKRDSRRVRPKAEEIMQSLSHISSFSKRLNHGLQHTIDCNEDET